MSDPIVFVPGIDADDSAADDGRYMHRGQSADARRAAGLERMWL